MNSFRFESTNLEQIKQTLITISLILQELNAGYKRGPAQTEQCSSEPGSLRARNVPVPEQPATGQPEPESEPTQQHRRRPAAGGRRNEIGDIVLSAQY